MSYSRAAAVLMVAYAGFCVFVAAYSGLPQVWLLCGAMAGFYVYMALEAWGMK